MSIPPYGMAGFASTRFVHAGSSSEASQEALRLVAESVGSEQVFATSTAPILAIDCVTRVWSPFRPSKPNSGYSFWASEDDRQEALEIERAAGTGWW
ncbi:hypothetical protein VC218_11445 [Xanthomonas nasturtii]|uniref:hypothetical protein n=1 Tax=Xanthomonas nasturtii TaxID=1843581 RepID=UPI002B23BBBC|nr:hypothetical protein [Xanthomonas nasturtii]MEA9579501.1 hypothetical protein [Xanthomonas nasturtii]